MVFIKLYNAQQADVQLLAAKMLHAIRIKGNAVILLTYAVIQTDKEHANLVVRLVMFHLNAFAEAIHVLQDNIVVMDSVNQQCAEV